MRLLFIVFRIVLLTNTSVVSALHWIFNNWYFLLVEPNPIVELKTLHASKW